MTTQEFEVLQRRVKTMQDELLRAEGTMANLMETLKTQFKCETVEEATKQLVKMETLKKALEAERDAAISKLEGLLDGTA